ncbi:MAG: long-chain-fatty-acid--CoA ligase [Desulfobacterota bacterium]|jgi:acyl-CoA synthetase (AMP-forming)/AMP-acid ligase II|nr:long-chain-fatty-acid--CoA ligase [Thermodesulfobacteriota bacterium]
MNTIDFLNISYAICPERDAMVFDGTRWSYGRTYERVNRLANAFRGLGIRKGDRVGMLQVNCRQYIESYFASAKIGAIFVPLNFRAKAEELAYMIGNAGAKALLVGARYLEMVESILPKVPSLEQCICIEGGEKGGFHGYDGLIASSQSDDTSEDTGDEDITILMHTSGTTGRPKGVPLRHSGFVSYVLENVEPANPEIEERNLLTVPLYHVAGIQAMLAAIYGGRTLVLMRQFETEEWMKTVEREKATRAMLVPTMLKWVVDHPDFKKHDLSSLKVITYGAASMPFEVIRKAIAEMPWVRFINAFGQTETASTITSLGPEDHVIAGTDEEKDKKLKRLTCSIGKPLPDVEISIVDGEGKMLPPHEVGEIIARGPRVMTGYWGDEEKTKQVLTEDGWLRTGDQGWVDEEGYIYLAGRADDMIIRGGENISPEEVEDVVCCYPKIDEVACVGVPHPEWGQEPRALVVLKKGESATPEEIMDFCKDRLAGFKRPKSVIFLDCLPRNQMGKLLRKELREKYGQPEK